MHMSNGLVDYRGYVLTTPSPLMSKLYRNYRGYVLTTPPPPHVEVNEQHENL